MLFKDAPYKVVHYLAKLSKEKVLPASYRDENYIRYLLDRKFIEETGKQFSITKKFEENVLHELGTVFNRCSSFLAKHGLGYLANYYSVEEIEALIKIEEEKQEIIENEMSLQNILTKYFRSSKYKAIQSNLSRAIKSLLGIEQFPEEIKDQQFTSILYPNGRARFIILCENKNRLITPRHAFIEYWYAGGRNTKQLQFIPKPKLPVYYLFDWDFDGLNIYIDIKRKYFANLSAFIPLHPEALMVEQEKVKNHHSKWKNDKFLIHLNKTERSIAEILIDKDSIIEEQNILLTKENLAHNSIL